MEVTLNKSEIAALDVQDPDTEKDGGWQSLIVGLQKKVDRGTGKLTLSDEDLEKIPRYAFKYKKGGWEDRLIKVFGRTLGPKLDGNP